MNEQSKRLLEEICKASQMGIQATKTILPKAEDPSLKQDITNQYGSFVNIAAQAEKQLASKRIIPDNNNVMSKAVLWGSIQLNALKDTSPSHIAEMMINGGTMGLVDMTKKMNDYSDAEESAHKLAQEYIHSEEKHIEEYKKYL